MGIFRPIRSPMLPACLRRRWYAVAWADAAGESLVWATLMEAATQSMPTTAKNVPRAGLPVPVLLLPATPRSLQFFSLVSVGAFVNLVSPSTAACTCPAYGPFGSSRKYLW